MNNDLDQFSEERLMQLASGKYAGTGLGIQNREVAPLARIALSVKQSSLTIDFSKMSQGNINDIIELFGKTGGDRIVAATTQHPCHTDHVLPITEDVLRIMQEEWDEWCADTGCIPDDFEWRGGKGTLSFEASRWAARIAARVSNLATPHPAHTELVIRDGWKLVPEEATLAMLTLLGVTGSFSSMQQKYQNMLDAAPMHDACLTNEDAKSDGWIKCSERMPDRGVDVLACKHSVLHGFIEIETAQWHGGMINETQPNMITSADSIQPTHWMPLPAAPKPESE